MKVLKKVGNGIVKQITKLNYTTFLKA